jgi:hypothetical protein
MTHKIPLETQKALEILQKVAAETLDRKRRLGHYAVIWQDGKSVAIGEDAPADPAIPASERFTLKLKYDSSDEK